MDKEKFRTEAKKKIDEIFFKIDELELKKDKVLLEARTEFEQKIAELKSGKKDLQENYQKLENASEEKWDEVKEAFSSSADSFQEGFAKIASLFK